MDHILAQMLEQHQTQTIDDKKNSLKEVVQEIVLCGLSRGGFFRNAAFYGGTALRIFYGLDRFSEDYLPEKFTQSFAGHGKTV